MDLLPMLPVGIFNKERIQIGDEVELYAPCLEYCLYVIVKYMPLTVNDCWIFTNEAGDLIYINQPCTIIKRNRTEL